MYALARAATTIPIGTAYAVWVGIGAAGTAVVGVTVHGDPATTFRAFGLVMLIVALVGLKTTSGH